MLNQAAVRGETYDRDDRCLDVGLGEQEQRVQVLKHDHGELEEPQHVDVNR